MSDSDLTFSFEIESNPEMDYVDGFSEISLHICRTLNDLRRKKGLTKSEMLVELGLEPNEDLLTGSTNWSLMEIARISHIIGKPLIIPFKEY